MLAAMCGKLGCLDHLIAKGAKLHALDKVRRGPAAAWRRRGVWGSREGARGRLRAAAPPAPRAAGAPLAPLRPSAAAPRRRPAAGWRALGRPARMQAGRGASGAVAVRGCGVGWGVAPASGPRRPPALISYCHLQGVFSSNNTRVGYCRRWFLPLLSSGLPPAICLFSVPVFEQ